MHMPIVSIIWCFFTKVTWFLTEKYRRPKWETVRQPM